MTALVVAIFCLTYLLIASRRVRLLPIGRPAGALLGAVLMVAVGALSPAESFRAIDHDTLLLLFGMMLLTAYMERAGFFESAAAALLAVCRSPLRLLLGVGVVAAGLSALLVNDTVCLFLTPAVVVLCRRGGLPIGPYLLALATSANIGSAATLVGNPQNMLIGSMSGLPFTRFLLYVAPAAALGVAINLLLLWAYYGRALPRSFMGLDGGPGDVSSPSAAEPGPYLAANPRAALHLLLVLAGVVAGFFAGLHLGYTALAGGLALMVLERRDPDEVFARVDWSLLVFFAGLFVVVAGLASTGAIDALWAWAAPRMDLGTAAGAATFAAVMTLGSNLVSNVPLVLITGPHLDALGAQTLGWVLLAFVTTVAGNLTLVGSVANIIVAERAREHYTLGFWEYLRFGAVSTVCVLAAGVPLLCVWVPLVGAP